jgi:hypothetical protein
MTNDVVNAVADAKRRSLRSNMATPSRRDALRGGRAMQKFPISAPGSGVPLTALDNIIPFAGKRESGRDVCSWQILLQKSVDGFCER